MPALSAVVAAVAGPARLHMICTTSLRQTCHAGGGGGAAEHHGVEGESLSSTAAKTHAPCFSYTALASFSLSAAVPPYTNSSTAAAAAICRRTPPSCRLYAAAALKHTQQRDTKKPRMTDDLNRSQPLRHLERRQTYRWKADVKPDTLCFDEFLFKLSEKCVKWAKQRFLMNKELIRASN